MHEPMPPLSPRMLDVATDPRSDVFNRLLKDRVVMLGAAVDDDIANQLCAQLLYLEGEDKDRDIWLYINSPGGSVTSGMAIYDTMQFVSCDVATVCIGLAASMGQFLLTAGAPGKRYTLPNARIMMHQPLAGLRGQAADIAIQAEQHAYTKRRMAELIAFHTGQPVDQITADLAAHLRAVFAGAGGTHEDWDEFDQVMADERRTAVLVRLGRLFGNPDL